MKTDLPASDFSDAESCEMDPAKIPTTEPPPPDDASDLDASDLDVSDLDDVPYDDVPCTDGSDDYDDAQWETFVPDEDERDPLPDPGDFWVEGNQDKETGRQGDMERGTVVGNRFVAPFPTLLV
jgi:hypothetical protein